MGRNKTTIVKGQTIKPIIYTYEFCEKTFTDLKNWLLAKETKMQEDGTTIEVDAGNCLFIGFLYERGLYKEWLGYAVSKHKDLKPLLEEIREIQEYKLQLLALKGYQKEGMTKFILTNKHGWREKTESKTENTIAITDISKLISFDDDKTE
jgi:predicted DNA-binding transcriptional regulator